jgi:two-component system KDP operon response regulator KdpE
MNKGEILIIDDEQQIRRLLEFTLETNGYVARSSVSAKEGLIMAENHPPDLILLDLGLPDESGHLVLKKLRKWYTNPVIILSVQKREIDIIDALDNGANDYLSKPFRVGELLARIRTALRNATTEDGDTVITCKDLHIELTNRVVKKNGHPLKLTSTEYNLLALFARSMGKVLTHQFLLRSIWGPGYIEQSQYLRVFIAQIRKKIEADPNRPEILITESGVGYRLSNE